MQVKELLDFCQKALGFIYRGNSLESFERKTPEMVKKKKPLKLCLSSSSFSGRGVQGGLSKARDVSSGGWM